MGPFFAISGPPINKGNKKLPNPPIKAGITIKKSRVGLGRLHSPPPSEPYVIVSNHTALRFIFNRSDLLQSVY